MEERGEKLAIETGYPFGAKEIEEGIRSTYSKRLFQPFTRAIVQYSLVEPGDRIAVCISGGKDSMLMAKLFQELKRHNKFPFELLFLVMDPGYSEENRLQIERNAAALGIPIEMFCTDIFQSIPANEKSPCYVCARMRRGHLYRAAKDRGCNKIALGHHFDDVIETILMGMLYAGQLQTMLPKLDSRNFGGMQLIRPMYYVRERDITAWQREYGLHFLQCACRLTKSGEGKRQEIKQLIRTLKRDNPQVESNLFSAVQNVNLGSLLSYKDENGNVHRFDD